MASAATLIYVISQYAEFYWPRTPSFLDQSAIQAVNAAFAAHWQFGREIVCTYGPWGFLEGGYFPSTGTVSLVAGVALSLVFWFHGWQFAAHFRKDGLLAGVWLVVFAWIAGRLVATGQAPFVFAFAGSTLLLLSHFCLDARPLAATNVLTIVSLALLCLVKFTYLMAAVMAVGAIALDILIRQRRFPWIVPLFGAGILLFWVAARQRLDSLLPFLKNSLRLSNGWTEAFAWNAGGDALLALSFLLVAALSVGLAGYAIWARHRLWGLLPSAALAGMLFLLFKYGFVRRDGHDLGASEGLLLCTLPLGAAAWLAWRAKGRWSPLVSFSPVIASLVLSLNAAIRYPNHYGLIMASHHPREGFFSRLYRTLDEGTLRVPQQLFRGPELRAAYRQNEADIRKAYPLPNLEGSVDVYPAFQMVVAAHGLKYQPRPVIQSNLAGTPELAEMNADHLRSERAPDNILFTVSPIDYRFPSFEDGLSWPELLTRFEIQGATDAFLVLKRSASPGTHRLIPEKEIAFQFGETIGVPSLSNGLLWARLEVHPTRLGAVATTLYKPPILSMKVKSLGAEGRFRLVPGMARAGFLLSPLIPTHAAFAALVSPDWRAKLAELEVNQLTVLVDTPTGSTVCYQTPLRLSLYRLELAR